MQKYAHLVELEKCCLTHIFLQNFVFIQPRTSPPKDVLGVAEARRSSRSDPDADLHAVPLLVPQRLLLPVREELDVDGRQRLAARGVRVRKCTIRRGGLSFSAATYLRIVFSATFCKISRTVLEFSGNHHVCKRLSAIIWDLS